MSNDSSPDEPLLSVGPRVERVVALLSVAEYIAWTRLCEIEGLGQSALMRTLIRERMRLRAVEVDDPFAARGG